MEQISELKTECAAIKADIATLRADVKRDIAQMETEVRVTKHDVINLRESIRGVGTRFDKFEEKISGKIDALAEKLTGVGLQQARGFGFFAGVSAVVTCAGGVLLFLGKLLFGHGG